MSVFPNPVADVANISIPTIKGVANIRVFDMYGKMVMQQTTSKVNTQINMQKLPSGIYLVKVMNDGKESTMKLVKE